MNQKVCILIHLWYSYAKGRCSLRCLQKDSRKGRLVITKTIRPAIDILRRPIDLYPDMVILVNFNNCHGWTRIYSTWVRNVRWRSGGSVNHKLGSEIWTSAYDGPVEHIDPWDGSNEDTIFCVVVISKVDVGSFEPNCYLCTNSTFTWLLICRKYYWFQLCV